MISEAVVGCEVGVVTSGLLLIEGSGVSFDSCLTISKR